MYENMRGGVIIEPIAHLARQLCKSYAPLLPFPTWYAIVYLSGSGSRQATVLSGFYLKQYYETKKIFL